MKIMKHLIFVFALFGAFQLAAQSVNDTVLLKEVRVSDSVFAERNVYDVDSKNKLEVNSGELLKSIPGITVLKRGAFATEPMIRTFKYDQVNTIIDGGVRASSSCPNRMDPLTTRIAPNEINKVELVKGPYNVRYGQVLGGSVNIKTQKPQFSKSSKIGANAGVSYGSNGNGITAFGGINYSTANYFNSIAADFRKADNYTSGDGTEIASSFQSFGFNYKGGIKISDKQVLTLNAGYTQANDVMHAGLPMDADYDKSTILSVNYSIYSLSELIQKTEIQVYYSQEDHQMSNANRPNVKFSLAETPVESADVGGKMEFTLAPLKNSKLYLGTDYWQTHKDGVKNVTMYENACSGMVMDPPMQKTSKVWQDSYQSNWGLFGQFEYNLSSSLVGKVGLRSNYSTTGINDPADNFKAYYGDSLNVDNEMQMNYFASVEYFVLPKLSFALKGGVGSRNPDLLERYINHFTVGLDMYEYVGNPTLESEQNQQIDFVITKKGPVFTAYLDLYYSNLNNYISAVEDTTLMRLSMPCKEPKFVKRFINIDNAQMLGGEVGFNVNFAKYFLISSGVQYNYAQNLDWDEPLPEIPPLIVNGALRFSYKKVSSVFDFEYQAEQTRIAESFGEKESSSFFVGNLNVYYTLTEGLRAGLQIQNLFNENYYRHLSRPYKNMDVGSPFFESGRSFNVNIIYSF